jgi:hypothetical protein
MLQLFPPIFLLRSSTLLRIDDLVPFDLDNDERMSQYTVNKAAAASNWRLEAVAILMFRSEHYRCLYDYASKSDC